MTLSNIIRDSAQYRYPSILKTKKKIVNIGEFYLRKLQCKITCGYPASWSSESIPFRTSGPSCIRPNRLPHNCKPSKCTFSIFQCLVLLTALMDCKRSHPEVYSSCQRVRNFRFCLICCFLPFLNSVN